MTKPLAWSYSALEDFKNCPHSYHEKRVLRRFPQADTEELVWGRSVHKAFELRQQHGQALDPELEEHEEFMQHLESLPGEYFDVERQLALDKKGQPVNEWFGDHIWWRGVIDYRKLDSAEKRATIVDYKTGKPHEKWAQLAMFAIHTFMQFPQIDIANCQFYWTKTKSVTKKVWGRGDIPVLWNMFLPDLQQYKQAFKEDVWQMRPSGLCYGWCPVTDCPNWKPKKPKR